MKQNRKSEVKLDGSKYGKANCITQLQERP